VVTTSVCSIIIPQIFSLSRFVTQKHTKQSALFVGAHFRHGQRPTDRSFAQCQGYENFLQAKIFLDPYGATLTLHIFGGDRQAWRGTQKASADLKHLTTRKLYRRKPFTTERKAVSFSWLGI